MSRLDVAHGGDRRDLRGPHGRARTATTTVTTRPVTNDEMTAVAGIDDAAGRDVEPERAEQRLEPDGQADAGDEADDRRRSARPRTASNSTEPSTWRWPAPIARSSAISRLRWATMIEKVLKMMNDTDEQRR